MNLREAMSKCQEIEMQYRRISSVAWTDVYGSESEIVDDLKKVFVPAKYWVAAPPLATFSGYSYIYSFAFSVQNGKELSEKQMRQAKRLAVQIKKAAAIGEYKF